jgi:hypothetical protein
MIWWRKEIFSDWYFPLKRIVRNALSCFYLGLGVQNLALLVSRFTSKSFARPLLIFPSIQFERHLRSEGLQALWLIVLR